MVEVHIPPDVALRRARQEEEYGQYVATEVIPFNGVVAFNPGDPVPVGHVKRFKWDETGVVERVNPEPEVKASKKSGREA